MKLLLAILIFSTFQAFAVTEEPVLLDSTNKIKELNKEDSDILQRHNPFFFAYGHELSKLQISFKTPAVRQWPLYFGYTQIMFWALNRESKPFEDLTFNPELFYQFKLADKLLLKTIDFGLFNHNSNGKSDKVSRSYNKSYVRLNFDKEFSDWIARFSVQVQGLYDFDPDNKDIYDYISPLAFSFSFIQLYKTWLDKSEVSLQAVPGGRFANHWDHGGYQLSWSFRLGGIHLVPAFYLQYYKGFAETLLNYDQRVDVFRVGVIF